MGVRVGSPNRLSGVARSGSPGQNPNRLHHLSWGRLGCNLLLAAFCPVQAAIINLACACARCVVVSRLFNRGCRGSLPRDPAAPCSAHGVGCPFGSAWPCDGSVLPRGFASPCSVGERFRGFFLSCGFALPCSSRGPPRLQAPAQGDAGSRRPGLAVVCVLLTTVRPWPPCCSMSCCCWSSPASVRRLLRG